MRGGLGSSMIGEARRRRDAEEEQYDRNVRSAAGSDGYGAEGLVGEDDGLFFSARPMARARAGLGLGNQGGMAKRKLLNIASRPLAFVSGGKTTAKARKPKISFAKSAEKMADSVTHGKSDGMNKSQQVVPRSGLGLHASSSQKTNPPPVVDKFAELLKSIGTDPEQTKKHKEEQEASKAASSIAGQGSTIGSKFRAVRHDRDFAKWEQGTKGFGSKMLAKFGFRGRLGMNEQGIAKPIEAVKRPGRSAGLGSVKETSTVNRENNRHLFGKSEAELEQERKEKESASRRGKRRRPEEPKPMWQRRYGEDGTKSIDASHRKRTKRNGASGRGSNSSKKTKVTVSKVVAGVGATLVEKLVDPRMVSSRDIIDGADGLTTGAVVEPTKIEKILDMTGRGGARVVESISEAISFQGSDHSDSSIEPSQKVTKVNLGEEIRFNLRRLVEMNEVQLHQASRQLSSEKKERERVLIDIEHANHERSSVENRKRRLEEVLQLFDELERIMHEITSAKSRHLNHDHVNVRGPNFAASSSRVETKNAPLTSEKAMGLSKSAASVFERMLHQYRQEFNSLELLDVVPCLVEPILQKTVQVAVPSLLDPDGIEKLSDILALWSKSILNASLMSNVNQLPGDDASETDGRGVLWVSILERLLSRTVSSTILSKWQVDDTRMPALLLIETLRSSRIGASQLAANIATRDVLPMLQRHIHRSLVDADVNLPSYSRLLQKSYRWLHPWLPVIGLKRMQPLFADLRKSMTRWFKIAWDPMSEMSAQWDPDSKACILGIEVISPWTQLFSRSQIEAVVERGIMHSLDSTLARLDLGVLAKSKSTTQSFVKKNVVEMWKDVMGNDLIAALLSSRFLPCWLKELHTHLYSVLQADSSGKRSEWQSSVLEWYTSWTEILGEFKAHTLVKRHLSTALAMINTAMAVGESHARLELPEPPPETSFSRILIRMRGEMAARANGIPTMARKPPSLHSTSSTSGSIGNLQHGSNPPDQRAVSSFRDVVEMFAQERGVEFLPVVGRFYEGKVVYSFNGALSYIDRGVLFMRTQRSDKVQEESWRPMSLEEAFGVSNDLRQRGKRRNRESAESINSNETTGTHEADMEDID